MEKGRELNSSTISAPSIQIGCLFFVSLLEIFYVVFGRGLNSAVSSSIHQFLCIAAVLFAAVSIRQPMNRQGRNLMALAMVFCAWFLLLQLSDLRFAISPDYENGRFLGSTFLCEYLLMLPFACLLDENQKTKGLKIFGWSCMAEALIITVFGIMLLLKIIPPSLTEVLQWIERNRLGVGWNPNGLGILLTIGISFCMIGIFMPGKRWVKPIYGMIALGAFVMLGLTNSMTAILGCCCIWAGVAFLAVYRNRKKNILPGLLAAGCTAVLIVVALNGFYKIHYNNFLQELADTAGVEVSDVNWQETTPTEPAVSATEEKKELTSEEVAERELKGTLAHRDYRTSLEHVLLLGGRAAAWKSVLQSIAEHPAVLLIGARNPGELVAAHYYKPLSQCHNSWLQVLLEMGIVGLVLAVFITYLAVKNGIVLLFCRKTQLYQKIVCMLMLGIMLQHTMESGLFLSRYSYNLPNMVFLFCLGYVISWVKSAEPLETK